MDLYLNQDLGSLRVIVSDSFLKRAAEEGMRRTTVLSLPGGWSLEFTGTRASHADGRRFQNIGIVPDVKVEPTVQGLAQGIDEVLEKGLEVVLSKLPSAQ
jgi:hypothetical protein